MFHGRDNSIVLRFVCSAIVTDFVVRASAVTHEFTCAPSFSRSPIISSEDHCGSAFADRQSRHRILESRGGCRCAIVTGGSARTRSSFQSAKDK